MTIDKIVEIVFDEYTLIDTLELIDSLLDILINEVKYNIESDDDKLLFNRLVNVKVIISKLLK